MVPANQTLQDASLLGISLCEASYNPSLVQSLRKSLEVRYAAPWVVYQVAEDAIMPRSTWAFQGTDYGIVGFAGIGYQQVSSYFSGLRPSLVDEVGRVAHPGPLKGWSRTDLQVPLSILRNCTRRVLCGHSYGGVVTDAGIASIPENQWGSGFRMITFGSPRAVPSPSGISRDWPKRFHWVNHLDAIPSFPPQSGENVSISLSLATTIGEWPDDFRHIGQILVPGPGGVIFRPDAVTPLAPLAILDLGSWIVSGGGFTAFDHMLATYRARIEGLADDGGSLWGLPNKLAVPAFDAPEEYSNGLLTFRRDAGFPATDFMRCMQ